MALKATVVKAELHISDLDRHYYATHTLTLAQHPSETDARLMVRLAAFALFADDALSFGRGLSTEDEPDLWRKSLTGEIEQWIDLGQPDESRIRKACGRAREVVVIGYSGRSFTQWWDKQADALVRCTNLDVLELTGTTVDAMTALFERNMRLQCLIEDRTLQLIGDGGTVEVSPIWRQQRAAVRGG
ncbi:MAG TPA: YaeQ family protein [Vicinamibacterales bacterium]|nr:YaeQ family protein [Vicinamibacterales bacterium]